METVKVFWKGKFNGRSVAINAADFDPAIHRNAADGPWPKEIVGTLEQADGEFEDLPPFDATEKISKPRGKGKK